MPDSVIGISSKADLLPKPADVFYYPPELAHDLEHLDLPNEIRAETLATAWEYTRCVIPQYTNWPRYLAFVRLIVAAVIAEFRGEEVNITETDDVAGYHTDKLLAETFEGTAGYADMVREYKAFMLMTGEKVSERRNGELFRRYVDALAHNPEQWFRLRDCDALARFTIAGALVCNDLDDMWFTENQWLILAELGDTMYDAVAFYKHRSEGETHSTFAYMPEELRIKAFHTARELLWALDVAWARQPSHQIVINFVRFFGGTIHMMTRRYRFVEENLSIGKPEDEILVKQTREHHKLWNRVEDSRNRAAERDQRYEAIMAKHSEDLMFPGMAKMLQTSNQRPCDDCQYRSSYGAQDMKEFGGVQLCRACRYRWLVFHEALPHRAAEAFPELHLVLGPRH
ncbi:Hypothetical protein D9617_12g036180 [Elsinoe fawcettii]|nr:Hypothetical protein D9617_12g036180 [Elsinoe fawcettii]